MITFDAGAGQPTHWLLCFTERTATWWLNYLPVGRFRHLRAFGCVPAINTWIFYDPSLDRHSLTVARGDAARVLMAEWMRGAAVIGMPVRERKLLMPRFGNWCVPAIKQLIGLRSGALRPDALWRDCLRQGGEVIAAPELHPGAGPIASTAAGTGGSGPDIGPANQAAG